ncbi:hypothetical protein [Corynebacterium mustelae]|uniref:hypothetical protein n=1 Tax=Corynebacterium mustelae TaxID=571915 RepID=UPI00118732CC|nr:hypothetical protein [Corynebacterium mustelae]
MLKSIKRSSVIGTVGLTILASVLMSPQASAWSMQHPTYKNCTFGAENVPGRNNPAGGFGHASCEPGRGISAFRSRVVCTPWHGNTSPRTIHGAWRGVTLAGNDNRSRAYCAWYEQPTAIDVEVR